MRAYMESGFYLVYLLFMISVGCRMLQSPRRRTHGLFGAACVVLGLGDAFHLVPRAVGLFTATLDAPGPTLAAWLGVGKLITSVTMTLFYVLLYLFLYRRTGAKRSRAVDALVCLCTLARLVLCALPQNAWLTNSSPLLWGILRNIPFTLLGCVVIVAAFRRLRSHPRFGSLWLVMILSFGFYLPVVLWAASHSWVGMLMLPKTICYAWIALMGLQDSRDAASA